jgi:uncharacterized protein YdeI (YjbR/CyaY-like superfamily)
MKTPRTAPRTSAHDEPLSFADANAWSRWLAKNHASSRGVWLLLAKKGADTKRVAYREALDAALAWGWIDAQKRSHDERSWLQRFTPRTTRSAWSKVNRERVAALTDAGKMHPAGLAEVERAKADGRWAAAYDSAKTSTVPSDLAEALAANPRAQRFFATVNAANRYAVLYRVQTAKKPETRARRIALLVAMLARGETIHPQRSGAAK